MTWGAVLSFALRQPLLARALGLLHEVTIPVGSPTLLNAGGWLFIELDPAGPIALTKADAVRRYAARMPALAATPRPLFAAVLLPVGLTTGQYDEPLAESAIYDDGFGKIVHAAQAVTVDAASASHDMIPPATDAGIDLGWDDEQVTLWFNRQLEALRVRVGVKNDAIEAPMGVSGYRIDVRMPDDPARNKFESLCRAFSIDANGARAPLHFPVAPAPAIFTEKRSYLEAYRERQMPTIQAQKASWLRGQVDILDSLKEWFEPLLEQADMTAVGINGRVLIDCDVQQIVLDFLTRKVYAWQDEEWDYRFHIDRALLEYCIVNHEEDWINQIFLSCRFEATRKGAYNEYVYNFFKCLTPERLQYAEGYYAEKSSDKQLWETNGYRIQRRCPHLKADLTRFANIENGVLTCTMHGWQFDLETGRCLTSEGHPLYTQAVDKLESPSQPAPEVPEGQINTIREKCDHCWYKAADIKSSAKHL